jgi:tripartite-type tricarboxylate transporter receptor subunit TctC
MTRILRLFCAVLMAAAAWLLPARADDYPNKPIRLLVGYLPGAATDFSARVMAEALTARLGQTVVVENKPGAASAIAVEYVARSAPDGYTLLWGNTDAITLLPAVKPSVPYKIPDDLSYVSRVVQLPLTLAVSARLPITSMAEFVAYAKANPGKLRYGSSGVGGALHVAALLLEKQAGIELTHVPYKGASAELTDLLGGFIEMGFLTLPTVSPYAKSGKVRLIAVTSADREPLIPDVPTMKEAGYPAVTMGVWFGMLGPAGLPASVSDRLQKAITEALNNPETRQRFAAAGLEPVLLGGDEYRKFVANEYQQWKAIAASAHILITE